MWPAVSDGYLKWMAAWLFALALAFLWGLSLRRRWKSYPLKLRFVHAALSMWMAVAALTAFELYFAFFYDESDSLNTTNVSRRWYHRHVTLNREGFRDTQRFLRIPPDGRQRIVFLGDSFTFGQGVANPADRFSDRVAVALEQSRHGKYAVSNVSVLGAGTKQLVDVLRVALAAGYQIDHVVYVICPNDIEDFYADRDGESALLLTPTPQFFLVHDTYFFNLMYHHSRQYLRPRLRNYHTFLQGLYAGDEWNRMRDKLDELRQLCADNGIDLRIAVFPYVETTGPRYSFRDAHRQITEYCLDRRIPAMDLEPELATHAREGLVANRFDIHPNSLAHRLAAEAMLRDLIPDLQH